MPASTRRPPSRARAALRSEWPRLRASTEAALIGGDPDALRRLGHYLQSTALLIGDDELVKRCAQLAGAAAASAGEGPRALLVAVDAYLAAWPPRS